MDDPGLSREESDTAVEEVVNSVVSEVAHSDAIVPLDSPSFSSSSFSVETAGSSENVTDHEQDIAPPVKKRKGRPPKDKQQEVPSSPPKKTPKKRAPASRKRKTSEDDNEKSPTKKRGRPVKPPAALTLTSRRDSGGGCLSQKMCKRPKRRLDSPDPFADDDEEFDRVTRKMTAPRKRAIDIFHNATVASTNATSPAVEKGLKLVPFHLIEKFYKDITEFGEVIQFPNDSTIFTDG